jgi:hypothetical protein
MSTHRLGFAALLLGLCGCGVWLYISVRHKNELPLTNGSVIVTVAPPADLFFPIATRVGNEFQSMTDVTLTCTINLVATEAIRVIDTDFVNREVVPTLAKGDTHQFSCPMPPDLPPSVYRNDVREAHVTIDVVFSVPDRWRRIGVRQAFELVAESQGSSWKAAPAILMP